MARKQEKRFIEEARKIMDENVHLARFNESLRNIEKLKVKFFDLTEENDKLIKDNEHLRELLASLNENNHVLLDQINFLEEIINGLQVIVSIKDLNKRNLLWYNQNYTRLLGYKHKELQELQDEETMNLYHPEDRPKIEERNKLITNSRNNRFSCVVRLRHVNGNWVKMNSDYIALKLNPDGSWSQAIEILSNIETQND
jgi:PAS domain S-box-containing protein